MKPQYPLNPFAGILTVREECDGGQVSSRAHEDPPDWSSGTSHLVLFVHGFNNNVKEARKAYTNFTKRLPHRFPKTAWYFWPGDANFGLLDFLDFASYPTDIEDARTSADRLATWLTALHSRNNNATVTLVGHSLGCRLIFECLHIFATDPGKAHPRFKALFLMAGAVPVELLQKGQYLREAVDKLQVPGWVFHSIADLVLMIAFPAGQTLAASMQIENEVYLEPIGRHGNPGGIFATVDRSRNRHGEYWKDGKVLRQLCAVEGVAINNSIESHSITEPGRLSSRSLPRRSLQHCKYFD